MARPQINFRLTDAQLSSLNRLALAQGATPTSLAKQWVEEKLAELERCGPVLPEDRLAAIEQRLATLEAKATSVAFFPGLKRSWLT